MPEISHTIIRLLAIWIIASFVCAFPACLFLKACSKANEAMLDHEMNEQADS